MFTLWFTSDKKHLNQDPSTLYWRTQKGDMPYLMLSCGMHVELKLKKKSSNNNSQKLF